MSCAVQIAPLRLHWPSVEAHKSFISSKSLRLSRDLSAAELRVKGRCRVESCMGVVHKCSVRALQITTCKLQAYCKEPESSLAAHVKCACVIAEVVLFLGLSWPGARTPVSACVFED